MATKLASGNFSVAQLQQLIARVERLHEERQALSDDISEVYAEAKAHGFDVKIMKQCVKLRKLDRAELAEQESLLQVYMDALGMREEEAAEPAAGTVDPTTKVVHLPVRSEEDAKLYDQAVAAVRGEGGKASAAFIQRRLQTGYNMAARLIERMEKDGIVSPANQVGRREIMPAHAVAQEVGTEDATRARTNEPGAVEKIATAVGDLEHKDPAAAAAVRVAVAGLANGTLTEDDLRGLLDGDDAEMPPATEEDDADDTMSDILGG